MKVTHEHDEGCQVCRAELAEKHHAWDQARFERLYDEQVGRADAAERDADRIEDLLNEQIDLTVAAERERDEWKRSCEVLRREWKDATRLEVRAEDAERGLVDMEVDRRYQQDRARAAEHDRDNWRAEAGEWKQGVEDGERERQELEIGAGYMEEQLRATQEALERALGEAAGWQEGPDGWEP